MHFSALECGGGAAVLEFSPVCYAVEREKLKIDLLKEFERL